jgi:hypothetical protein
MQDPMSETIKAKTAWCMAQMAEHLSRKCEVLGSTAELPETKHRKKGLWFYKPY